MGVLSDVRVLEIGSIGPGPMAALLLAQMGANVIRIGRHEAGKGKRKAAFDLLYRGRPLLPLDLKNANDREKLLDLVDNADVLIEGFRPGVCERLGIGPEDCLRRNPRLVYGRMTGWGQDGPLSHTAGHDINYMAIAGALHMIGVRERPVPPLNLVGDFGGGSLYLAFGIACALFERSRSGKGQVIDAAIVDGTAALLSLFHGLMASGEWKDERQANLLDGGNPVYSVYETSDAKHMAVGCLEPQFYQAMIGILGLDHLVPKPGTHLDPSNWPTLRRELTRIFTSKTRDEWTALFEGSDACVSPVLALGEAVTHPHNIARRNLVRIEGVTIPQAAPRFSRSGASTPELSLEAALAGWKVPGHEARLHPSMPDGKMML